MPPSMNLKILLLFADKTGVSRIVAETSEGSFGLLPHRLDLRRGAHVGNLDLRNPKRGRSLCGGG